MSGTTIRVSDYDLSKGVPEYNLTVRPNPTETPSFQVPSWTGTPYSTTSVLGGGLRTNLIRYPVPHSTTGVGYWSTYGPFTASRDSTIQRRPGADTWRIERTGTGNGGFQMPNTIGANSILVGDARNLVSSFYVRATSATQVVRAYILFRDASGDGLLSPLPLSLSSFTPNVWTRYTYSHRVPTGAVYGMMIFQIQDTDGAETSGHLNISDILVEEETNLKDYFDGSFVDVSSPNINWRMVFLNTTSTGTQTVVPSASLTSVTGVTPRRPGNRYAVTTLSNTPHPDFTGTIVHDPLDKIAVQANSTITYTQYVYVKSAASSVQCGWGAGSWDENFENIGGWGDTLGSIPTNQWVRLTHSQSFGGTVFPYYNAVFSISDQNLVAGDMVLTTDTMSSYLTDPDYFDGGFPTVGNTRYVWRDLSWNSVSLKTTSIPTSVRVFDPDNIVDFGVSEEAMSPNPADFSGGYGSVNFIIPENSDTKLLRGKTFELEDRDKGKTTGIVTNMSRTEEGVSVTTDSMLGVLNSWQTLELYSGNLAGLISYVFGIVELTLPVRFEGDLGDRTIVSRGYVGNLWDWIKQLLSSEQIEMSLVYNTVVFRPYRTYEAYMDRATDYGWEIAQSETARAVEVTYYNSTYGFQEFYPVSYEEDYSPTIMQVDANETVEYILQLSATPKQIEDIWQPYAVASVTNEPQTSSRYVVVGNDDLPIQPAQWNNSGGSLTVAVSEDDPTQVVVTLRGANIQNLAPFRIAMSSGAGNYYNSLHLVGDAVVFTPEVVRIPTGASIDTTGTDVGVTVTNPFIQTKEQAFSLGILVAAGFSGGNVSINGSAWDINRRGFTGGVYAQIANFNDSWPGGGTVADFNGRYAGNIIAEFNTLWDDRILDEFPVQAFGNAAGARIREDDAFFRITQATFGPGPMTYVAEIDTLIEDFNGIWQDATIEDFNGELFNKLIRDFNTIPLRREE